MSTIFLEVASPRPVPPYTAVVPVDSWEKGSKMWGMNSSLIPTPVSFTIKRSTASFFVFFRWEAEKVTFPPSPVNLWRC